VREAGSLIEAIQSLLRLQEIDLQLHAAREELASFPLLRAAAAAERAKELASVEAAEQVVADEERKHRALESELNDVEAVLERLGTQLYEVTSKHALEALQNELDRSNGVKSEKEDLILALLEEIDAASQAVAAARQAARDGEASGAAEEAARTERERALEAEVERLEGIRSERETGLDAPVVRAYDGARRKRLPAVVFVETKVCPVCQMAIGPQKWIELTRADALVHCGTCDRILYGDKVAQAEQATA